MDERVRFCVMYDGGEHSMSELCRQFGVSRKTGYETVARWRSGGAAGLSDLSHAPHHCPHALDGDRRAAVLSVRARHPTWGPRKIKVVLERDRPGTVWPAASTIGELLACAGLSEPRKRRRHAFPRTAPFASCALANDLWCIDFKGWFRTGDGTRCDPLTLQDQASRFLLRAFAPDRLDCQHVWPILDASFRDYGLPLRMRSDNGPPFASHGAGGLSALSVLLIKAGIGLERTDPASPQQNGRLERLHLTLKQDTASPPAQSLHAQQQRLAQFRKIYNEQRPHEALAMATPASVYTASPRRWSGRLQSPDYGLDMTVRRVRHSGEIKWRGAHIYVSQALIGEPVGLTQTETDGQWQVTFGPVVLGYIGPGGKLSRPRAQNCISLIISVAAR